MICLLFKIILFKILHPFTPVILLDIISENHNVLFDESYYYMCFINSDLDVKYCDNFYKEHTVSEIDRNDLLNKGSIIIYSKTPLRQSNYKKNI